MNEYRKEQMQAMNDYFIEGRPK